MNMLLIVRSEIISILILIFLLIYDRACSRYRDGKDRFVFFDLAALGHALFGLITEITVNSPDFPHFLNDIFHIFFFAFALLFSLAYFGYSLSLIIPGASLRKYLLFGEILCAVSIVMMIISPIDYLQGNGTMYSAGIGPAICYSVALIMLVFSDVLIMINYKKISLSTVGLLIPISYMAIVLMIIQIIVPEFLFSGAGLTIISVGVFFAIENPIGKFKDRAFIDLDTQLWNRNSYEYDMKAYESKSDMTVVLADINGLKTVNDLHGHLEGDALIRDVAESLIHSLKHAHKIYRIGGDEFIAVYEGCDEKDICREIDDVKSYCDEKNKNKTKPWKVSASLGYAVRCEDETVEDVIRKADSMMYVAKEKYYKDNHIERRVL